MKRIVVMTGDGKGKTSAGFGMLLRARGHGLSALVVQFIKSQPSGELELLPTLGVPVLRNGLGFLPRKDTAEFAQHSEAADQLCRDAQDHITRENPAFILLDEACTASGRGLLPVAALLQLIDAAAEDAILVFTGRDAPQALRDRADTVTVLHPEKHAAQTGCPSQRGVEF